ncbi:MAG: DUF4395 domain-containing protein [Candidatus Pacebacteria bacterium]|jgi:hypothetical protein|nr:DUF4395 domain-containing protein [Candidatus Paceibacterota bacterium]MBT3512301.1 DUF4395 domain-containing protein [Candidatus Paceibacterota bacterium]MBT4004505.1 DUF4395 domain-containing protein [Candidatus Paceibacterota bacterium]MBT4358837.1 DUF4395 domain-containing protein [Candidatus Paceibacterota bacterium]MBT4681214.1 DUF4395 domain-containing protein [Candidatus Paceibacterota bacterium]
MKLFTFGEKIKKYDVPVLNEREIRAAAGILFLFAITAFMNAWLIGNLFFLKMFIIGFLFDFLIRLIINPLFAPSMVIGRFLTQNQTVEYVGAPQKRFAWMIGLALAMIMFWLVVIQNSFGPLNLILCISCLTFLFFESAFGICIGCYVYNLLNKEKAQLCPGGVCEVHQKESIQSITGIHVTMVAGLLIILFGAFQWLEIRETKQQIELQKSQAIKPKEDCVVPQWAIDIGHEEMYKLHQCQ